MYCWILFLVVKYILIVIVDIFNIWNKVMFFIEVYNIELEFGFYDLIRDRIVYVILVFGFVLRRCLLKLLIKLVYIVI